MCVCASGRANAPEPVSDWAGQAGWPACCEVLRATRAALLCKRLCTAMPPTSLLVADPGREGAPCGPNRACYGGFVCCDALPYLGGNTSVLVSVGMCWYTAVPKAMRARRCRACWAGHPVCVCMHWTQADDLQASACPALPLAHRCLHASGHMRPTEVASRCAAQPAPRACLRLRHSHRSHLFLGRCQLWT